MELSLEQAISIDWSEVDGHVQRYSGAMERYKFADGYKSILALLQIANSYLSENKFWELVGSADEKDIRKLEKILFETLELVKRTSILLMPYCPD